MRRGDGDGVDLLFLRWNIMFFVCFVFEFSMGVCDNCLQHCVFDATSYFETIVVGLIEVFCILIILSFSQSSSNRRGRSSLAFTSP